MTVHHHYVARYNSKSIHLNHGNSDSLTIHFCFTENVWCQDGFCPQFLFPLLLPLKQVKTCQLICIRMNNALLDREIPLTTSCEFSISFLLLV